MRLLNLLSFVFCFVLFVLIWFSLLERFWCFSLQHPHSLQLPCNFQGDLKLVVPQKWCQGSSQGAVHKLSVPIRTQDGAWPLENLQAWSVSWEVTVFRNYYHGDTEFQSWKELPRLSSGVLHSYRLETAGDWSVLRTQASSYQARFWKEPTCVSWRSLICIILHSCISFQPHLSSQAPINISLSTNSCFHSRLFKKQTLSRHYKWQIPILLVWTQWNWGTGDQS